MKRSMWVRAVGWCGLSGLAGVCWVVMGVALVLPGCSEDRSTPRASDASGDGGDSADQENLDALRSLPYAGFAEGSQNDTASGVTVYEPSRSYPGYNLYSVNDRSRAELIDAAGEVVRAWSYSPSRAWSNCELLPNGDLVVVGVEPPNRPHPKYGDDERYILRFNWQGDLLWKRMMTAHHDVDLTPRDQLLTLTFNRRLIPAVHPDIETRDDQLTLLDHDGRVLRSISLYDAFTAGPERFAFQAVKPEVWGSNTWVDLFHGNSVEWMYREDLMGSHPIFSPSNVLVCFRHQDAIAVVDFDRARLVWSWGRGELSGPHDAEVLANGHILIFDNGIDPKRQWSRVVEMDPASGKIVWQYQAPNPQDFYTLSKGSSQRLGNGNTLIACSDQGRAFEVTSDGQVVWEFKCRYRDAKARRATIVRMKRYDVAFVDAIRARVGPSGTR